MIKLDSMNMDSLLDEPIFTEGGTMKKIFNDAKKDDMNKKIDIDDIKDINRYMKKNPDKTLADIAKTKSYDQNTLRDENKNLSKSDRISNNINHTMVNIGTGIRDRRSIVAKARNSILQFPVYIVGSIPVPAAHTISKAFERVYASFVQAVLSENKFIDINEANSMKFLKKFHTNLNESADMNICPIEQNEYYTPIDEWDTMLQESISNRVILSENAFVEFTISATDNKYLIEENARMLNEPLSGIKYLTEDTINSIRTTSTSVGDSAVTISEVEPDFLLNDRQLRKLGEERWESEYNKINNALKKEVEKKDDKRDKELIDTLERKIELLNYEKKDGYVNYIQNIIGSGERVEFKNQKLAMKEVIVQLGEGKSKKEMRVYIAGKDKTRQHPATQKVIEISKDHPLDTPTLLRENDIRKINGMLPYSMTASFYVKTKLDEKIDGKEQIFNVEVRYIIGIKTVLHLISIKDLSSELRGLIMGKVNKLQKVRAMTGEISWLKDYVLNLNDLKSDASKSLNRNKRWITSLKRLAEYSKVNASLFSKEGGITSSLNKGEIPIPNATLVLSDADVSRMISETGIDISIVNNAKALASSLFLIAVVIIDATRGTMKVLFPDSDVDWDVQSLSSLDAEVNRTENSQLMREISKAVL